uniref:Tonoplast intrinsic protein 2 n=1 Tax=Rhizophora mucronata TaxID=61149 RepID=A0A2P2NPG1_RHIMU
MIFSSSAVTPTSSSQPLTTKPSHVEMCIRPPAFFHYFPSWCFYLVMSYLFIICLLAVVDLSNHHHRGWV